MCQDASPPALPESETHNQGQIHTHTLDSENTTPCVKSLRSSYTGIYSQKDSRISQGCPIRILRRLQEVPEGGFGRKIHDKKDNL